MNILISWSGGLDSTYLVWKALSEGHDVYTYSINLLNNKEQSKRESKARSEMKKYFDKSFPKKLTIKGASWGPADCSLEVQGSNLVLSQPPLWILFSFYNHCSTPIDELRIGYVMNDDAISYLDDIRNLYNAYKPFLISKNIPKLVFPLTKLKKRDIISEMPDKLLKMIRVCEGWIDMGDEECGNCECCEKNTKEFSMTSKSHLCNTHKKDGSMSESKEVCIKNEEKSTFDKNGQGLLFPEYALN